MPIGKTYPEYKDSGVEWFGMIPKKWNVIPLKYLTLSKVSDGPHETPLFIDEGIPFLSVDGIQNNELVFEGCRFISEIDHERYSLKCKPVQGDVLLGKAASVGKVAYVRTKIEFNVWSPLAVISAHNRKLGKFIYYSLQSEILQYQCEVYSNSNTQKNLGMATIDNLLFSAPIDNKEIEYIIDFLDYETAKIDTMIEKQKTLIELLKEKRQAVISHAVTKGLDDTVPMKDSGVEWIGEIPEHWDVSRLKFVCPIQNKKNNVEKDSYIIALEHIESFTGKYISTEGVFTGDGVLFQRNDVLFGKLRPYLAKVYHAERKGIAFGDLLVYRPNNDVDSYYAFFQMISTDFIDEVDSSTYGTKMPRAGTEFINNMFFLIPPFSEQVTISNFIRTNLNRFDQINIEANDQIALLQERRTALISAAVTGKIDLRDWSIDT